MRPRPRPTPRSEWSASALTFLLLPVFAFVVTLFLLNGTRRAPQGTPLPPPRGTEVEVPGLTGALVGENGARVEVRLSPLHADADRQRFDTSRLRRRYALDRGQPWRLELLYHGDPALAAEDQPVLDLSDLHVVCETGAELLPIVDSAPLQDGLRDPLAALLARKRERLAAGEATQRILWGESSPERARVVGLVSSDAGPVFEGTATELALSPAALRQERELALFQAEVARLPVPGDEE